MRRSRLTTRLLLALFLVADLMVGTKPTQAAFGGANGKIAFSGRLPTSSYYHQIWTINPDGTDLKQLTTDLSINLNPAFSPNGALIAFEKGAPMGQTDIWVMNADGSGQTNLTKTSSKDEVDATWSPDGTKIAFVSANGSTFFQIWVMNADGTDMKRLLNNNSVSATKPTWSPDGTKIAFQGDSCSPTTGCSYTPEIYVMNADGTGQQNLTNTATVREFNPDWSPNGAKIVYNRPEGGSDEIYVMNADGTGQTRLTTRTQDSDYDPAWSPDGNKIVFISAPLGSSRSSRSNRLYVMNADGTGLVQITTPSEADDPSWQPLK